MDVKEGVDVRVGDGCECQRLRWSLERFRKDYRAGTRFLFCFSCLFSFFMKKN